MGETGISLQVIDEIVTLAQKHNIEKVVLFGSRARGDYHRASDIDLAVYGGEARELVKKIIDQYILTFCQLKEAIESQYSEILDTLS